MDIIGILLFLKLCLAVVRGARILRSLELSSEESSLHHLEVDPRNAHIYLAATNTLYVRTPDLQPVVKVSLGPRNDSESCPPDPGKPCVCTNDTLTEDCAEFDRTPKDSIVKSLVLDRRHNVLIVCSNLYYGYCSKVSLDDYSLDENYFTPVVSNSLVGDTVMLIGESESRGRQLYVGVSRDIDTGVPLYKDRAHLIAQRTLADFTLSHVDATAGTASFIDVKSQLRDRFPVYFEYGFSSKNYSYFLGVRPREYRPNEPVSFLVRICNNDETLHSFVELKLSCGGFNRLVSARQANVGSLLAAKLNVRAANLVIYATFVKSINGINIQEDVEESSVCLFSQRQLDSEMDTATRVCFSGIGDVGPQHIVDKKGCLSKDFVTCGKDQDNWPIEAVASFPAMAQYTFRHSPGAYKTAIAVKTAPGLSGTYTIGYLGSNKGELSKVVFDGKNAFTEFGKEEIGDGKAVKKDLYFDQSRNHLYAITDKKVMLISLYNCSVHADCEQCLAARDPHCGWCSLQNKCTVMSECEVTHRTYGWLSYPDTECPVILRVFPSHIVQYETNLTAVQLTIAHVRDLAGHVNSDTLLQCMLTGQGYTRVSPAQRIGQVVNCTPLSIPPPLPEDQSRRDDELSILVVGKQWLSTHVTLYDCTRRQSCEACVQADLPCVWCLKSNVCVNRRSSCVNQAAINSETAPLSSTSADRTGPQFCPKIEGETHPGAYITAAGVPITVEVLASELLEYQQSGLRCHFMHKSGMVVNATWVNRKIVCEAISLTYDDEVGSLTIPLQVFWDNNKTIDNPTNISIEVYKCALLATSCGECTLLDEIYGCGWCAEGCTHQGHCDNDVPPLGVQDICPNPQITDFEPKSGPHLGGTLVTITGINLGKSVSDIKEGVRVGDRKCKVLDDHYTPSVSLVCETLGSNYENKDVVQVQVDGNANVTAVSTEEFSFKDPVLVKFSPTQGPLAGGTKVTITGQYLDLGNGLRVFMNGQICNVTSVTSKHVEFLTAAQSEPGPIQIHMDFDDKATNVLNGYFTYIANPVVRSLGPQSTLTSGGVILDVEGENLHSSQRPLMLLRPVSTELGLLGLGRRKREVLFDDVGEGNTPYAVITEEHLEVTCQAASSTLLQCSLPRLHGLVPNSDSQSPTSLEYDVIIDDWTMSQGSLTPNDLDYVPIEVYPDPVILGFDGKESEIEFTGADMEVRIQGENLDVFNKVEGVQVLIGNTSSDVTDIQASVIVVIAPSNPRIINDAGNSEVLVNLGNFMSSAGFIKYRTGTEQSNHVVLAIVLGVVVTLAIFGTIVFLVLRHRNRKEAIPMRVNNGSIERTDRTQNVYGGEDPEEVPLKQIVTDDHQASGEEEEEDVPELQKPFVLEDFLERIRDPKLRENVREVIVPPEKLEMKDMIGRGNFGCVYLAVLKGDEYDNYKHTCRVAVKTLQGERLEQATVESFLKEGVIMKNFDHPHVLKLLGVCVTNHENPMVILPYMANGDLRSYVKDKKKNFTARQLLHLAQQVAEGMAYLSSLNFVHRDLAARNCMIDELDDVKVADFGLTRDLFEKQYFSTNLKEKRGKMPIKWMALESLEEFVFTTKSDVWSFGVLMWELMTRGVTPYPDVDIFDVRNYLAAGRRLRKPKYCPENIYKIMLDCWHSDPDIRPSFIDLVNRIELLLNPPKKRISEELNEPMYVNIRKANSTEYLRPSETPGVADA